MKSCNVTEVLEIEAINSDNIYLIDPMFLIWIILIILIINLSGK